MARMMGIPIFHVNEESPRSVAAAVKIAVLWRQRFQRDVIIDMYCYRKYGHNEGDEPGYTQPKLYKLIRKRKSPRAEYAALLNEIGYVTLEQSEQIKQESLAAMNANVDHESPPPEVPAEVLEEGGKGADPDLELYGKAPTSEGMEASKQTAPTSMSAFKGMWNRYQGSIHDETDTTCDPDRFRELLIAAHTIPEGFQAHRKVKRVYEQRIEMANGERPIDWAVAELSAFATLLDGGARVRMSGQDCGRGTFSHRHAVLTDIETTDEHRPLDHISEGQARFEIWDSFLSEYGVLGYEFGYSLDCPDGLVMWEAQFGDFANGAQIMIDQFVVSSELKWGRCSGLVMLLPHGYEGQGPEHSSARLELSLIHISEPTRPY